MTTDPAYANNVRSNPGTANQLLFQVQPGESFEIIGGPRCADGFVWWQIRRNGRTGWMVEGTVTEAWIERVNSDALQGRTRPRFSLNLLDKPCVMSSSATLSSRTDYANCMQNYDAFANLSRPSLLSLGGIAMDCGALLPNAIVFYAEIRLGMPIGQALGYAFPNVADQAAACLSSNFGLIQELLFN